MKQALHYAVYEKYQKQVHEIIEQPDLIIRSEKCFSLVHDITKLS